MSRDSPLTMTKTRTDTLNGGKKIIEFYLDSGQLVHVTPLSIYHLKALRDRAASLFPYPDEDEFEQPVDPERSIFPDEVIPATQNPAYQAAMREIDRQRSDWINEQCIDLTADFGATKDELIEQYAPERERLAAVMDLPEDEWEATFNYCIIRTNEDRVMLVHAAINNILLTEEEVREGVRLFRPQIRPTLNSGRNGQERTRGVAQEKPLSTEHDV